MPARDILLICNGYPSQTAREKSFILPELKALIKLGHRVTLMPLRLSEPFDDDCPKEVLVERMLSRQFAVKKSLFLLASILLQPYFWREMISSRRLVFSSLVRMGNFLRYSLKGEAVRRTLCRINPADTVYSYWCSGETVGMVTYRPQGAARPRLMSRMHGYDLYEERDSNLGYIPYRGEVVARLDKIVLLGITARDYLLAKYPSAQDRLCLAPLGVRSISEIDGHQMTPGIISFFSCSYVKKVKRLDVIYAVISEVASLLPKHRILWTHFGCDEDQLDFSIAGHSENLTLECCGVTEPEIILTKYRSAKTPFFVNMSLSEGQPVSIMEAMSCAMPVFATDVGGVGKLVGDDAGLLIPIDLNAHDVASLFVERMLDSETYRKMSLAALQRQRVYYDEIRNHELFARDLLGSSGS